MDSAQKHLHDLFGVVGDRFREIAAGRRYGADQRDRTVFAREGLDPSRAFVKAREARSEIGGVAFLHRHLTLASGHFAQRFGPAAGGIGHHHHVVALVAVILGQRDADVNRGFARHHRHVGGVGHQQRAFHQRSSGVRIGEFREAFQDVHQFVAALAATDEDDDIGVRPTGDLLLDHGLACAEGTRYGGAPALHQREEGVEDPLPGEQRRHGFVAR